MKNVGKKNPQRKGFIMPLYFGVVHREILLSLVFSGFDQFSDLHIFCGNCSFIIIIIIDKGR